MTAPTAVPRAEPQQPCVLFVDDEEHVLLGLHTTLRKLRREFEFVFVDSGAEALDVLAARPVDLIVTDMRMPSMSGADLLIRVRKEHPHVVRFVLSGEAEPELVLRAMPVVHRWLSKPCERERLTAALTDALRYRDLLLDPGIVAAVAGTTTLPSPPVHYTTMLGRMADPEVSVDEIADVAARDAALGAKVLQLANSAFSGAQSVADMKTAVARIGITAVSYLALSAELLHCLGPADDIAGFDDRALAAYGPAVAAAAADLASPEARVAAGVAGLLSHVGVLLEAARLPDRLASSYLRAEADDRELLMVEHELHGGIGHAELAGHLLSIWGLPVGIVLAVAGSHSHPSPGDVPPFDAPKAVAAARLVVQANGGIDLGAPHVDRIDDQLAEAVTGWATWIEEARPT